MRLITFGCSLTYGHGLYDCHIPPNFSGDQPSKLAWPQLIANILGIECKNRSSPGASNKLILGNLQKFPFKKNDIVICLWSHKERYTIFKENSHKFIGPWMEEKYSKLYYKHIYTDYDGTYDLYTRANWAKNYLDLLDIKNYHLSVNDQDLTEEFKWNRVDFLPLYMNKIRKNFPVALDNHHPGEEAHMDFAIKLEKLLDI